MKSWVLMDWAKLMFATMAAVMTTLACPGRAQKNAAYSTRIASRRKWLTVPICVKSPPTAAAHRQ